MLSYDKQRQLLIVCILGIILTVIIAIATLFFIWRSKPEKQYVFEVGKVESTIFEKEDVIQKYYKDFEKKLHDSDTEGILALVGEDYLEYNQFTKEDVRKYLEESNMYGKSITLEKSLAYSADGYNNVYVLDIKSDGEFYSLNVVIREKSPEKYTIAFDKFIDYSEKVYNGAVESIALNVLERVRYTTAVTYRFRVMNNYHEAIIINSNKSNNPIPIVSTKTQNSKQAVTSTIMNMDLRIEPNTAREFEATYSILNPSDYYNYNVFVLNEVKYQNVDGTMNLEYRIR